MNGGNCWDGSTQIVGLNSTLACTTSGVCSDASFASSSTCEQFDATHGWCDDVAETASPNYTTLAACQADRCSDGSNSNNTVCLSTGSCTNTAITNETDCIDTPYCSDSNHLNEIDCAIAGTCLDTDYNDQESVCMDTTNGGTCTDTTKTQDYNACTVGASNGLCQDASWTTEVTCTPAGSCINDIGDDVAGGFTCSYPVGDVSAHDNYPSACVVGGVCRTRDDFYDTNHVATCLDGYEEAPGNHRWWKPWTIDVSITSSQACASAIVAGSTGTNTDTLWSENSFVYPNNSTVDNGDRTFGDANTWTPNTWTPNTWTASNAWYDVGGSWTPDNTWEQQYDWLPHTWTPNNYSWSNNTWSPAGNVWARTYTWDNPNTYSYANSWLTNVWSSAGNVWEQQFSWWDNSYLNAGNTWYYGSTWNTYTFESDNNTWQQQHNWTPYQFTNDNNTWQQQHTWSLNSFSSDNYAWAEQPQWGNQISCPANNATWIPDPAFQNPPETYNIYRTDAVGHNLTPPEYHFLENTNHTGLDVSQQTYVDSSSKETITYYYKVTQVAGSNESNFSTPDSGYETQ